MQTEKFTILSLGWGVQSFTMLCMIAKGELPPIDAAVTSDTTWERQDTYRLQAQYTPYFESLGIKMVTVKNEDTGLFDKYGGNMLPCHTTRLNGVSSGNMHRQCTGKWKLQPLRKWAQENRDRKPVEQWLGITLDEIERVKPSGVKYLTNRYPLIEKRFRRQDCIEWLKVNNFEVPGKSSCVFCPYHDKKGWRVIKDNAQDWEIAIKADNLIRSARSGYLCYLTSARIPLVDCDFSTQEEAGQLNLWETEECSGTCFL